MKTLFSKNKSSRRWTKLVSGEIVWRLKKLEVRSDGVVMKGNPTTWYGWLANCEWAALPTGLMQQQPLLLSTISKIGVDRVAEPLRGPVLDEIHRVS